MIDGTNIFYYRELNGKNVTAEALATFLKSSNVLTAIQEKREQKKRFYGNAFSAKSMKPTD